MDQACSLVGLIHTIAPPAIREQIAAAALAPTQTWDALVCTSPAVQQAMEVMFDGLAEHLSARLGATRTPRPQLPLIPLAVDTDRLARQGADQQASEQSNRRMHFALVGWFPGGEPEMHLYKQAADLLAPDLNVLVMDGNDPHLVAQSWAAADVFLSLVDNIQETFGLTPIEAMAAGLPVVVSDWDG